MRYARSKTGERETGGIARSHPQSFASLCRREVEQEVEQVVIIRQSPIVSSNRATKAHSHLLDPYLLDPLSSRQLIAKQGARIWMAAELPVEAAVYTFHTHIGHTESHIQHVHDTHTAWESCISARSDRTATVAARPRFQGALPSVNYNELITVNDSGWCARLGDDRFRFSTEVTNPSRIALTYRRYRGSKGRNEKEKRF